MIEPITPVFNGSVPYSGELQNGLLLIGLVKIESNWHFIASCFLNGAWENLNSSISTHVSFSGIKLSNGVLSFSVGSGSDNIYVSVFQTDDFPTD